MKKLRAVLVVMAALFLFSACAEEYEIEEEFEKKIEKIQFIEETRAEILTLDLEYVMEQARQRREAIEKPDYNILLAMTEGRTPAPGLPGGFDGIWGRNTPRPEYIRMVEAVADTWALFNLLRDVYGGYVYFGGDEVFSALLTDVVTELFDIRADAHTISANAFAEILHRHLSQVVVDNHFWIGAHHMGNDMVFFHAARRGQPVVSYYRSENGFRNRATDLYLLEIRGHDIDEVMHLHVNEAGELFYSPMLLSDSPFASIVAYFVYEDDESTRRTFLRENTDRRQQEYPTLEHIDGIPVITVMAMGFDGHEDALGIQHAQPFIAFAEELRDEPVIIIDIRSNSGGNGMLPTRWVYALTGEIVPSNYVWLTARPYRSETFEFDAENAFQNPPGSWNYFWNVGPFGEGYTIFRTEPRRIVETEQKLILLIDRHSISAAEDFADLMFNMSNTLVLGEATGGALAFDLTYSSLSLPNSGKPFGLGRGMMLWPDGHFEEGLGIAPDIWVAGDALAAALALVDGMLDWECRVNPTESNGYKPPPDL